MQCKLCREDFHPNADEEICPTCGDKLKSVASDSSDLLTKTFSRRSSDLPGEPQTEPHDRGKQIWKADNADPTRTSWPLSIALHPSGELLVLDEPDEYRILRLDPSGKVLGALISISIGPEPGSIEDPQGLAVGSNGNLYVPDAGNDRISVWTSDGTFLKLVGGPGDRSGQFAHPMDVDIDADGFLYVADTFNRRIQKLSEDGLVSLVVEDLDAWGAFAEPVAITIDSEGNIYVADADQNRLFMLSPDGEPLRRMPDSDVDSLFEKPGDVRCLPDGTFVVSDRSNLRIRRFDTDWNLTGTIDLSHDGEDIADGGDIAVLNGNVVIPDRFNDCVFCMAFDE